MANKHLHGNGEPCPDCDKYRAQFKRCKTCKGDRRRAKPTRKIVAEHAAWARKNYWPQKARPPHRPRAGL